ncbi:YIP1 family protein [Candidatus Woesearchaeota archaeon]|nr:YIP1 family protein [Candidatus Woesearchaeota archaeon]
MPAPKLPKPPVTVAPSSKSSKSSNVLTLSKTNLLTSNLLKYWSQFRLLFTNPSQFYNSVKSETDVFPIILKYVVFMAVLQVIMFLVGIYGDLREGPYMILFSFIIMILSITFSFIMPFIMSGITHLGVLIFGGKQLFFNTFKTITYSMFLAAAYNFVSLIMIEILNIILNPTFETITEIMPQLIVAGIIGLIGLVHVIYTQMVGLGIYQQLTKLKALFAIIIIPLAILLFIILVGILFALMLV